MTKNPGGLLNTGSTQFSGLRQRIAGSYMAVPIAFVAVLFIVNLCVNSKFISPSNIAATLAVSSPYILASLAQAMPALGGGGGVDMSVGPVIGFTTVLTASILTPLGLGNPAVFVPIIIVFGLAVGALNGLLAVYVRLPPIVATMGTYLVFVGLAPVVMPIPGGSVPAWLVQLVGSYGPIPGVLIVYVLIGLLWFGLRKGSFVRNLLNVGGDDRAAYTAGIRVNLTRLGAYALGGLFSALAGMLLAGTIQSGDATVGPIYTVTSLAAIALGGISLAGGRGGLLGAALGGVTYYLIQNLLTIAHVSVHALKIASGLVLILALALNGLIAVMHRRRMNARSA
ncbi:MAG: ABC transporter permease [Propionibacteriaceae bacterium]|jgi:ribose transport system permease protein|nr:ABC transporter permease [Propionibacteriaceae bacterium]